MFNLMIGFLLGLMFVYRKEIINEIKKFNNMRQRLKEDDNE